MRWTGDLNGRPFSAAATSGPLINKFYAALGNLDTLKPIHGFAVHRHVARDSEETAMPVSPS